MKRMLGPLPAAILLVAILLTSPIWFPRLSATAAQKPNALADPIDETSTFYILDGGWTSGSLNQKVLAVPQVLAWSSGTEQPDWAIETGFLYGGVRDETTGRIYVTEQRNPDYDTLLNVTLAGDALYATNSGWKMFLTAIDPNGQVISRQEIDLPSMAASGSLLQPVGVNGDTLYLMNYADRNNLMAYDLASNALTGDTWSLCEKGYLMQAEFFSAQSSSTPSQIAALCVDYSASNVNSVTLTDLSSDEQRSLDLPQLGAEEYQSGNGIFQANGVLYAIDSEAGVLVKLDVDTMQITQQTRYRAGLGQQTSGWLNDLLAWFTEQLVRSAAAKRWSAITAVSQDGRWLAVDGGAAGDFEVGKEIFLVDLQTMKGVQSFQLSQPPVQMEFANKDNLCIFFEKRSASLATPGILLDTTSGYQTDIRIPTHGWIREVIPVG